MKNNKNNNNMNSSQNIKLIRFARRIDGTSWYGFSESIMLDEKDKVSFVIKKILAADNTWAGLTDSGRGITNMLISMKGISYIHVSAFSITVSKEDKYQWSDFHADIIDIINMALFEGTADVDELGVKKDDEGLIRWLGTGRDAVRCYDVSTALKIDEKDKNSVEMNEPIEEKNWCGLTEEARLLANTIYAMKGVFTIWIGPFDIRIELAHVFWRDYHNTFIELLTEKIFNGKAFVEQCQN